MASPRGAANDPTDTVGREIVEFDIEADNPQEAGFVELDDSLFDRPNRHKPRPKGRGLEIGERDNDKAKVNRFAGKHVEGIAARTGQTHGAVVGIDDA